MNDIIFDSMEKVKTNAASKEIKLTVSIKGEVRLNTALKENLEKEYDDYVVDLRYADNYRILAFKKSQENHYKLPVGGYSKKDRGLADILKGYGYGFPAVYKFTKREDGVWIGILQEVAPLPAVTRRGNTKKTGISKNEQKRNV